MAGNKLAAAGLAVATGCGSYLICTKLLTDPKEMAKQSFTDSKVCVRINFCSEWSYMPKAKSVMWALQEEFDEHDKLLYYQVLPNLDSKERLLYTLRSFWKYMISDIP